MPRKNRKDYSSSFEAYRVAGEGFDSFIIFAGSSKAAERVARRILGGVGHAYDGPLNLKKEEKVRNTSHW